MDQSRLLRLVHAESVVIGSGERDLRTCPFAPRTVGGFPHLWSVYDLTRLIEEGYGILIGRCECGAYCSKTSSTDRAKFIKFHGFPGGWMEPMHYPPTSYVRQMDLDVSWDEFKNAAIRDRRASKEFAAFHIDYANESIIPEDIYTLGHVFYSG